MGENPSRKKNANLGFLSIIEDPEAGTFGGFLILNTNGRPLEFHCTAPVRPNRAQENLYGSSMKSFLYGELIGLTLVEKSAKEVIAIFTDEPDAMGLRELTKTPLALVADQSSDKKSYRIDLAHQNLIAPHWFEVGVNKLTVAKSSEQDASQFQEQLSPLIETFDLSEPFFRIREAIKEAQLKSR